LKGKIEKYEIEVHNMYNMDEKGFLIGVLNKSKRIYTKSEAVRGKLLGAGQDGNREWITVIASICADGTSLPPGLIYQAISGNLQDSWLQDFNPKQHRVFFSSTATGWTNNEMGFSWLTTLFDVETKKKAGNGRFWRLLILDGHGSHINMNFLDWCHKHRILVAAFPSHSTHRLQPLDVSLFSPLSTYYSQELNNLICESQGLSSVTKRDFFRLFWATYDRAFTRDNILSGWANTGLSPLNPEVILSAIETRRKQGKIASRPSSRDSNTSALSASDWRKVRKLLRDVVDEVIEPQAKRLENTVLKLTTDIALLRSENEGLRKAFSNEKKKRTRGKPLFDELRAETDCKAMLFSPSKIERAIELQEERKQLQHQEEVRRQDEKVQKQLIKEERQLAIVQRKQARIQAKVQREKEAAEKRRQREEAAHARAANLQLQNDLKLTRGGRRKKQASRQSLIVILKVAIEVIDGVVISRATRAQH
jgi:DDE superfamily endonuclease